MTGEFADRADDEQSETGQEAGPGDFRVVETPRVLPVAHVRGPGLPIESLPIRGRRCLDEDRSVGSFCRLAGQVLVD